MIGRHEVRVDSLRDAGVEERRGSIMASVEGCEERVVAQ